MLCLLPKGKNLLPWNLEIACDCAWYSRPLEPWDEICISQCRTLSSSIFSWCFSYPHLCFQLPKSAPFELLWEVQWIFFLFPLMRSIIQLPQASLLNFTSGMSSLEKILASVMKAEINGRFQLLQPAKIHKHTQNTGHRSDECGGSHGDGDIDWTRWWDDAGLWRRMQRNTVNERGENS